MTAGFERTDTLRQIGIVMASNCLIEATKVGNLQQMALMVKAGEDVNQQEPEELTTPLYWAACCGQEAACDWLIHHGSDLDQHVKWLSTPLHAAADRGNLNCALLLVRKGARVNIQNNNGDTPLHKAAYRGNVAVCSVLLHGGASVSLQNSQKKTASAEAQSRKHYKVFQLLTKWANDPCSRCRTHSMASNTEPLTPPPRTPIRAIFSQPIPIPSWEESSCCIPHDFPKVETTTELSISQNLLDVDMNISDRVTHETVGNGSHVMLMPCEGRLENVGQGQLSANQRSANNSSCLIETQMPIAQLEDYVFRLQLKLTEKADRIEKLENDRRRVISGLTRFRYSMATLQRVNKENAALCKHIERTEQKYKSLQEEMTAVREHNRHLVSELGELKLRLDGECENIETTLSSSDLLSSDDFLQSVNSAHYGISSNSSPGLTALKVKSETMADIRDRDIFDTKLPPFRSVDQSCLSDISTKLSQQNIS